MGFGILWFVWFKLTHKYCPCVRKCTLRPKQPHRVTTAQKLNECDTGLQVIQKESEEGTREEIQRASPKEVGGSQVLTAEFVQHGRLTVDHL